MYGYVCDVLDDKGTAVFTTTPRTTVRDAVRAMNEKGVGCLLVMESMQLRGMFTERDVMTRVVDAGRAPALTTVGDVMTPNVITVAPRTPISETMTLMTNYRLRHLPVEEGGRVVGLVSIGDLLRHVSLEQERYIQRLTDYVTGRAPA